MAGSTRTCSSSRSPVIDVWDAAAPWVEGLRKDHRAGLFRSVDWLAARMTEWERNQTGSS